MYVENSFGDFGKIKWANIFDPLKLREKIPVLKDYTAKTRAKREAKGLAQAEAKTEVIRQIQEIEKAGEELSAQEAASTDYTPYITGGIGLLVVGGAIFYYWKYMRK